MSSEKNRALIVTPWIDPSPRSEARAGIDRAWRGLIVLGLLMVCGCTAPGPVRSTVRELGAASAAAAMHPLTWAPLSAGLVFGTTGLDESLSDWATDRRPIFQSADRAAGFSDVLRGGLLAGSAASSLLAPLPPADGGRSVIAARLAANLLAYGTTRASVDGLKAAIDRDRPNREDDRSLPSGHAGTAFNAAASIELNLAHADLSPGDGLAMRFGAYGLAGTTAWARLEAGKHFPSDVLVGAALGNFLARFFLDALSGPRTPPPVTIDVDPDRLVVSLGRSL